MLACIPPAGHVHYLIFCRSEVRGEVQLCLDPKNEILWRSSDWDLFLTRSGKKNGFRSHSSMTPKMPLPKNNHRRSRMDKPSDFFASNQFPIIHFHRIIDQFEVAHTTNHHHEEQQGFPIISRHSLDKQCYAFIWQNKCSNHRQRSSRSVRTRSLSPS